MKHTESEKKCRTLADEYQTLKQERQAYLDKAKEAARYTIPSLIADRDSQRQTGKNVKFIETPNQSVGADGVNNLASKITATMLPPNQTFFKFSMDRAALEGQAMLEGQDKAQFEQDVNKGLSIIEKALLDYQEQSGDRVCLGEAVKHQLIAGNVFLVHDPKEGLRYYPLDRYVVKRDYCGNVIKAITEETINYYALPNVYYGDFSNTACLVMNRQAVGTVSRQGLIAEPKWILERLSHLLTARILQGHGILRPDCAVEISASDESSTEESE